MVFRLKPFAMTGKADLSWSGRSPTDLLLAVALTLCLESATPPSLPVWLWLNYSGLCEGHLLRDASSEQLCKK